MDPVSAISFASTILSFVDFSWNLVKGSYQVYHSNPLMSTDHVRVSTVVNDLQKITEALQFEEKGNSKHLEDLRQLAAGCAEVSQDLLGILGKLEIKEGNKMWQSLKVTWKGMQKEKEIVSIEQRLNAYRLQLLLRLNLMLSEQQSSVRAQLDELKDRGASLSEESLVKLADVCDAVKSLEGKLSSEILAPTRVSDAEDSSSFAEIRACLLALVPQLKEIPRRTTAEECILRRLYFASMHSRLDNITDPEMGTFAWLLEGESLCNGANLEGNHENLVHLSATDLDSDTTKIPVKYAYELEYQKETRSAFLAWLRFGNGIYHISGKAGSGKSTLMRFLSQNKRLIKELEQWAGHNELSIAHFFFWSSGDKEQRSLEGLYRSLLYEVLNQCPRLIQEVFPKHWVEMKSDPVRWIGIPFLFSDLRDAMNRIAGKCSFPDHRFCFFIDGLDEFEGDSTDHEGLAQCLKHWALSTEIKICVSSRPHTEFLNVFNGNLRMHLHDATRADIERFVCAMFQREPNYDAKDERSRAIVSDIVNRADGVFLWVRLVVRSLIEGFRHRYSLPTLKQKLDKIPQGLNSLFDGLFNSIDNGDRENSDKMLLLVSSHGSRRPLNALLLSWLEDLENPDFPFKAPVKAYSDEILRRHELVRCQLDSLSKGLLEMVRSKWQEDERSPLAKKDIYFQYEVQFFHRTVLDYLKQPSRHAEIQNRLGSFDTEEAYHRLLLAEFKFARTMNDYFRSQMKHGQTALASCFFRIFIGPLYEISPQILEECNKVLDYHRQNPFSYPGERMENSGIIHWGRYITLTDDMTLKYGLPETIDDISYVRYLAADGQREFLIGQVLCNSNLLNTENGLNLLFSASLSPWNHALVCEMLRHGMSPNHRIPVTYETDPGEPIESGMATVWAAFLFIKLRNFEYGISNKSVNAVFMIIEHFLRYDADGNVYFLIRTRRESSVQFLTLKDWIELAAPPNMDTLLRLVMNGRGFWLWHEAIQALSALAPWIIPANEIESKYERAHIDKQASRYWFIESIYVDGEWLQGGFIVKWY